MTSQPHKAKRWQFSLQNLFALTTSVAVTLAIWPLLLVGVLTTLAVSIAVVIGAAYYWRVFAIGAIAGVVVTRLVVLIGRWLDAREPS